MGILVVIHALGAYHEWSLGLAGFWDGLLFERDTRFRISVGGRHLGLVENGEVWRMWTSMLLHADALHLFLNCVALVSLGRLIEPWVGAVRWMAWFILGGLSGAVCAHFAGVVQSDGASGGAFALLGAAAVLGSARAKDLDPHEKRLMGPVLWGFLVLNVVLSFALPFIDAAGHLGGLFMGLVLGGAVGTSENAAMRGFEWILVIAFVVACAFGWSLA